MKTYFANYSLLVLTALTLMTQATLLSAQTTVSISSSDNNASETFSGASPNPGSVAITRTGSTTSPLTVWLKISGTATRNVDYSFGIPLSSFVVIPAGVAALDIPILPIDDFLIESTETIRVELEDETNTGSNVPYSIGTDRAIVNLTDNEDPNLPQRAILTVSAPTSQLLESQTNPAVFRISRTANITTPLTIYFTLSGSAQASQDYTALPLTASMPAGAAFIDLQVVAINDAQVEAPESIVLTLDPHPNASDVPPPPEAYAFGTSVSATITLISEDLPPPPTVTITAPGNGSRQSAPGTVDLQFEAIASDGYITRYQILQGTNVIADQPTGYASPPPNGTPYLGSLNVENIRAGLHVFRTKAWSDHGIMGISQPIQTIVTNIPPVYPVMSVTALDSDAAEGAHDDPPNTGLFRISVDSPMPTDQFVLYRISSPGPGFDFVLPPSYSATNWPMYWLTGPTDYGYAHFPKGATSVDIPVVAIDDALNEGPESLILTLSYPFVFTERTFEGIVQFTEGGFHTPPYDPFALPPRYFDYDIGTNSTATITLTDNDTDPTPFSIVNITATQADTSETLPASPEHKPGVFTLSRVGPTDLPLSVRYQFTSRPRDIPLRFPIPVQAQHGVDFEFIPNLGTAIIPAGASSTEIVIQPILDFIVEGNEYVQVSLLPSAIATPHPSSYLLYTNSTAQIVIRDLKLDAFTPIVRIRTIDSQAYESGPSRTAAFSVERNGSLTDNLVAQYRVGGSAINGVDYASLSGSITIPAGSPRGTIVVDPIRDETPEAAESVSITLLPPSSLQDTPPYVLSSSSTMHQSAGASIRDELTPPAGLPRRFRLVWLKRQLRHAVLSLPAPTLPPPSPETPITWAIDASSDMSLWEQIGTTSDPDEFVDVNADDSTPQRFYRFREVVPTEP